MLQKIDSSRSIVKKFIENFFIKDFMGEGKNDAKEQEDVLKSAGH